MEPSGLHGEGLDSLYLINDSMLLFLPIPELDTGVKRQNILICKMLKLLL